MAPHARVRGGAFAAGASLACGALHVKLDAQVLELLDRLHMDRSRLFGAEAVRLSPVRQDEREASRVLKVDVTGAAGISALFIKVYQAPDNAPLTLAAARERVEHDYGLTARLHARLEPASPYGVAKPLACFADHLAIVTAEVSGETLLDLLERRAPWWPSARTVGELGDVLYKVGRWIRVFQRLEPRTERFSLDTMREYIDVRLRRLLVTRPPALQASGRERVLRYFDRMAARVEDSDLEAVATHGDLAPSNVIVRGEKITVIDFAMAGSGGLFMDVARLHTQLEFLTSKPKFRPSVVRELQRRLLAGFDPDVRPGRPLFQLFLLQHLLCHMSNLARNPAPLLSRLYNRHQLRLRRKWLDTFAA